MRMLNDRTNVVWDAHDKINERALRQKESTRILLHPARSVNAGSEPEVYAGAHLPDAQRVHGSDYSTMNVYQPQRKNAYNPFSSALADVFGIEEGYS